MKIQDCKNIQKRGSRRKAFNPFVRRRTQQRAMQRIYQSATGREYLSWLAGKIKDAAELHSRLP